MMKIGFVRHMQKETPHVPYKILPFRKYDSSARLSINPNETVLNHAQSPRQHH